MSGMYGMQACCVRAWRASMFGLYGIQAHHVLHMLYMCSRQALHVLFGTHAGEVCVAHEHVHIAYESMQEGLE